MNGTIRRRGKNTWELRFDLPRGPDGRRRREHVAVKGTKAEAQRRLRELLHQGDTGLPLSVGKESVSQFMERWLADHVAHTTRPRTQQFYAMLNRLYISPAIGALQLQKLTPGDVQGVIGSVLDRGLSPTTARRVYATLHRALACALKWGAVYRNVCDAIDPPREAEHEFLPPDRSTVRALLIEAMETPYAAAFWLLAYSGARRGEVCAIKREDIDLDNGTVSINGAIGRVSGKLGMTPPKSNASRRVIHLDIETVTVLRSHLVRQASYRLSVGASYHDQGFVFASPTGGVLDPDSLTKTWQRVCRDVGVKYRLHDLRHAHITALIQAGVHVKIIQSRVGHSSPAFTLAKYGHLMPGMDKEAAFAYAKAMSG